MSTIDVGNLERRQIRHFLAIDGDLDNPEKQEHHLYTYNVQFTGKLIFKEGMFFTVEVSNRNNSSYIYIHYAIHNDLPS